MSTLTKNYHYGKALLKALGLPAFLFFLAKGLIWLGLSFWLSLSL